MVQQRATSLWKRLYCYALQSLWCQGVGLLIIAAQWMTLDTKLVIPTPWHMANGRLNPTPRPLLENLMTESA